MPDSPKPPLEDRLASFHAGWLYAARYAEIEARGTLIASLFADPDMQFGYDLWHDKQRVEARDQAARK